MDQLHAVVAEAIRAAVVPPEQCLDDEEECFVTHPVHSAVVRNGQVIVVEADVDGLVDIILATVLPVHRVMVLSEVAAELDRLPRIGGTNAR